MRSGNVLVVSSLAQHPLRATARDHLLAFDRHWPGRTFHLNLAVRRTVPQSLRRVPFDLVVLHTSFLAQFRWTAHGSPWLRRRAQPLKGMGTHTIALPQDDFLRSDLVSEIMEELGVDHVFTPVPPSEHAKVYRRMDLDRVRFHLGFTGYLEDAEVAHMTSFHDVPKTIDIGYRAWHAAPWLGRHGQLKTEIARVFAEAAPRHGLHADVSTAGDAVLLGDDWSRFMAASKYTIGVEGGASILDQDGSVRERTDAYVAAHPDATFDEIEAACFPGRDGELALRAISPRHLEACVARTCQVLVEGDYDGVLQAGVHYLPVKADFSDLEEVLETMKRDDRREAIVEAAWRDIVASDRFTYRGFVREVQRAVFGDVTAEVPPASAAVRRAYALARASDRATWAVVAVGMRVLMPAWLALLDAIPVRVKTPLKAALARRSAG